MVAEETFLSLLAVFVHGVPYHLEVNCGALDHFFDIFFLEVVAQDYREDCRGEQQNLSGVHGALHLVVLEVQGVPLGDGEQFIAEVVGLLEQGLLSNVVLNALQIRVGDWKLSGLIFEWEEYVL